MWAMAPPANLGFPLKTLYPTCRFTNRANADAAEKTIMSTSWTPATTMPVVNSPVEINGYVSAFIRPADFEDRHQSSWPNPARIATMIPRGSVVLT